MRAQCPSCKRTFIHATGCPVKDDRPHRPAGGWPTTSPAPPTITRADVEAALEEGRRAAADPTVKETLDEVFGPPDSAHMLQAASPAPVEERCRRCGFVLKLDRDGCCHRCGSPGGQRKP